MQETRSGRKPLLPLLGTTLSRLVFCALLLAAIAGTWWLGTLIHHALTTSSVVPIDEEDVKRKLMAKFAELIAELEETPLGDEVKNVVDRNYEWSWMKSASLSSPYKAGIVLRVQTTTKSETSVAIHSMILSYRDDDWQVDSCEISER